jgi:hypothetical protein
MHLLQRRGSDLFKLPRRALSPSPNSLLNGRLSLTRPNGVETPGKIVSIDKTRPSLSYYLARTLCLFSLLFFYHHATDVASLILTLHWVFLLQPWLRRRMPQASLPARTPHRQASLPFAFPAEYLLTSSCMLLMSFVGFFLGLVGLGRFTPVANPLMEQQAPRAPPRAAPDPHDFLPQCTRGRAPASRLLHLGLLAAIAASDAVPTVSLRSDKALKRELRKYRGASGFMTQTSSIKPPALSRLRTVLESAPCYLLAKDDNFELIMDSGCSKSVSLCAADFVPGSLVTLTIPLAMDGTAGQLVARQKGRLRYEVLNNAGGITVLECDGYHLPELKIRLFSPQILLGEQQGGKYVLEWNTSYLLLANGDRITIGYHRQTSLPVIRGFHNVLATAKSLALEGVSEESKSNLTSLQQHLFRWHTKWGHLGWQHTQWLGRCGLVGRIGIKMGSTTVLPPKCAACQLGKQQQTSKFQERRHSCEEPRRRSPENEQAGAWRPGLLRPV